MKLRPHQQSNSIQKFYAQRTDLTISFSTDEPTVRNDGFFRHLEVRRTLWANRKPTLAPDQESCLCHLRDQFIPTPFPKPSLNELTALATHPDFPIESVTKLIVLFNQC